MRRALLTLALILCASTAWAQYPYYAGFAQPFYAQSFAPYGYGYGGYGGFGYGGFGPYGFGVRGYYPPNPFGNLNWLPPIPPSPYYVVPSDRQYLEQAMLRDRQTYGDLVREHYEQK
jgi:hypothetical protein